MDVSSAIWLLPVPENKFLMRKAGKTIIHQKMLGTGILTGLGGARLKEGWRLKDVRNQEKD